MWIGQTVALVASRVVAPRPRDRIELLDLVRAAKAFGLKVSVLPRMLDVKILLRTIGFVLSRRGM